MDTMTITKAQLQAALLQWERDARDGKCLNRAGTELVPIEMVARANADHMWQLLGKAITSPVEYFRARVHGDD